MPHTQQKPADPELSKGTCGKHKISTICPKREQKDALTFQEKLDILAKMQKMGWTQKQTALYYNREGYGNRVSQVNISHWLKEQEKMQSHISEGGINATTSCTCSVRHPELEAALTLWVQQQEVKLLTIKGGLIIEKAERIAKALNAKGLKFSDGWLAAFKEWHMLQDRRRYGEAGSVKVADADAEQKRMQSLLGG